LKQKQLGFYFNLEHWAAIKSNKNSITEQTKLANLSYTDRNTGLMHESKGVGKQNTSQELTPTRGTGPPPAISTILDTRRARSHAIIAQKDDL